MALGGYARRELCPASDIDVVLLHDGWGRTDLEALVQQLCYPLWDAGLSVGHAVRTPAEAAAAASDRIDTATAVLDRRLVAGDAGLVDAFAARVRRWTRRNGRKATVALDEENRTRRSAHGRHAGALEPNLKEGAGGLRDIHSLRWAAGWVVGEPTLDGLVAAGYISADDRRRIAAANATLLQARCALHQVETGVRGRDRDVLRMEWHDQVAARLGMVDGSRGDGERMLREVLLATRAVAHVHNRTWPLLLADVGGRRRGRTQRGVDLGAGVVLSGTLVDVDPGAVDSDPSGVAWRCVAAVGEHHAHLGRDAATHLPRALASAGVVGWTAQTRAGLLATLGGAAAATALAEADHVGLLAAHLPDWHRVRALPQRNPLHRFDLDTHGAHAVGALHRLRHSDEDLAALWSGITDTDALLLATWLHDVGKAWPGDHAQAGADVVAQWLETMGFAAPTVSRAAGLVRWHLLLPDVATRRDLDDPAQIRSVADILGDSQTADALLLLSLADSRATSTAAWSAWKDSLLARLHREVRAALGEPLLRSAAAAARDSAPAAVTREALAALRRVAPPRYFEVADDDQATAHAALLPPDGVRAAIRGGRVPGTAVVSVAAADRERLIADCTGVLAGLDVDVYEARAFTGSGDVALAWFTTESIAELARAVPALEAIDSETTTGAPLRLPRRRGQPPRGRGQGTPDITLRAQSVEVEAHDSPALLYRLTAALSEFGYGIAALRVSTLGATAFDVFDLTAPIAPDDTTALRAALIAAATP